MILCFRIVGLFLLLKTSLDNDDEFPPKFDSRDVKYSFPPPQIYLGIGEEKKLSEQSEKIFEKTIKILKILMEKLEK